MKKKRLIYIAIVLGVILIVVLSNIMMRESYIKSVELTIDYPSRDRIIFEQNIENDLIRHFGILPNKNANK